MKKKKTYRYGVMKFADNTVYYDAVDKEISYGSVITYCTEREKIIQTKQVADSEYGYIIKSSTISYEMFENSPEISIVLLQKEYEEKI